MMKESRSLTIYFVANGTACRAPEEDIGEEKPVFGTDGIRENNINQYGDNSHKSKRMYGTTDDTLGRRLFQVQKEKAVEEALEKIRRRMGSDWCSFSTPDCDILKDILGEAWTNIDRHRWGTYCFSKLSLHDLNSLITIGKVVKAKPPLTDDMLKSLDNILSKTI